MKGKPWIDDFASVLLYFTLVPIAEVKDYTVKHLFSWG